MQVRLSRLLRGPVARSESHRLAMRPCQNTPAPAIDAVLRSAAATAPVHARAWDHAPGDLRMRGAHCRTVVRQCSPASARNRGRLPSLHTSVDSRMAQDQSNRDQRQQIGFPEAAVLEELPEPIAGAKDHAIEVLLRQAKLAADLFLRLVIRSEEHTSELQSQSNLVCRLLLEKKRLVPPQQPGLHASSS